MYKTVSPNYNSFKTKYILKYINIQINGNWGSTLKWI